MSVVLRKSISRFTEPAKESSKGAPCRLPVLDVDAPFTPHNAWVFPMMASLRANLDTTKTPYAWKVDPFELFDEIANTLVKVTNNNFDGKGTTATLGKNSAFYELLLSKAETAVEKASNRKQTAAKK